MENHTLDLKDRASFRFWTPVTIRFSDQDPLGHVNNVAYAAYIEAARTMFLGGLLNPDDNPGIDYVLARVVIDYVKETHYPGTVDVGGRVTTVGTKSITSGYGVFVGDQCIIGYHKPFPPMLPRKGALVALSFSKTDLRMIYLRI